MSNEMKVISIGSALAKRLAQAVCGDDHLTCSWPTCGCKSTKRKINAVALVIGQHIGEIEGRIADALDITRIGHTDNSLTKPDDMGFPPS